MACESLHPTVAAKMWREIIAVDHPHLGQYLDDWKKEDVFTGLALSRRTKGSIDRDSLVDQIPSVREQFTVDKVLENFGTVDKATSAKCVAVYDETLPKDQQKSASTKCGLFKNCFTMNEKGELESAQSRAKTASKKDGKGRVVRGFCMPSLTAANINRQNNSHFTPELQLYDDKVRSLQRDKNTTEGKSMKNPQCLPA
jgi:hypothetical protein